MPPSSRGKRRRPAWLNVLRWTVGAAAMAATWGYGAWKGGSVMWIGIPVGVIIAPVIPGLTDHEIPAILEAAAKAGTRSAAYTMLRLPFAVKDLFQTWLEQHFPEKKDKVLSRVRELRGGKLNESNFGTRMKGQGPWADLIRSIFHVHRERLGLEKRGPELSTAAFRRPGERSLFDGVESC